MRSKRLAIMALATLGVAGCAEAETSEGTLGTAVQATCMTFTQCTRATFPWSSNVIYYRFDSTYTATEKSRVRAAFDQWEQATAWFLDFQESASQTPYIFFKKVASDSNYSGGTVHLAPTALDGTDSGRARIAHEIGHALDLAHEQQRHDRDRYLNVNEARIGAGGTKTCADNLGTPWPYNQTWTRCGSDELYGAFDYDSLMLYDGRRPGDDSYTRRDNGGEVPGYQGRIFSPSYADGAKVLEIYNRQFGWAPAGSLGIDVGSTQPLTDDLDPSRVHSTSAVQATMRPAIVRYFDTASTHSLRVAVRGSDGRLWIRAEFSGGWNSWSPLGTGIFASAPAMASWGPGRLDVIARGLNNEIYKIAYHSGWESGYTSLGMPTGGAAGSPVITAPGSGLLDVFTRGADGNLWRRTWDGSSWSSWSIIFSSFGILGDPSGVAAGGKTYIVLRKTDGSVHLLRIGTSLEAVDEIGSASGSGVGSPAIASWGTNRFDVFVRGGTNSFLWQKAFIDGAWDDWRPLGMVISGDPAAAEAANVDAIDIVASVDDPSSTVGSTLWRKKWQP